jgi:adenosylhomocysteine nucleosidase
MFWQTIIRTWIARAAKERLYEELTRAAQAKAASGPAGGTKPSDSRDPDRAEERAAPSDAAGGEDPAAEARRRPCDAGLVFALAVERGAMEDRLDGPLRIESAGLVVRQGGLRGRHVVLVDSGVGGARAARATELLIAGHKPAWVISAGLAGGLAPDLRRGDIVMADSVAEETGHGLAIDLLVDPAELAKHPRMHVGRVLTIDRIVATPAEKRSLGERHQALAVDRESFAVAEVCRAAETRFLAIRAILDPLDVELPPELGRFGRRQSGVRRVGGLVGAVWNRPSAAKDLLAWQEHALMVSDRLAKFLEGVVTQLVP